jgi:hypothetical protein
MKKIFLMLAATPVLLISFIVACGLGLVAGLASKSSSSTGDALLSAYESGGGAGSSGGGGSGVLNYATVINLARAAGIPSDQLATAAAIAMAESGFNTSAVNYNTNGSVDRGLWQINSIHTNWDINQEFNSSYNAQAMAQISNHGTNWGPWSTYASGKYLQYLPAAQQAVSQSAGTSI